MEDSESIRPITRQSSALDLQAQREHRRYRRRPSIRSTEPSDERTGLLGASWGKSYSYGSSIPGTPRPRLSRHQSGTRTPRTARTSRAPSFTQRLTKALSKADLRDGQNLDDRVWYDQFTSTDWINDAIKDAYRVKALRARKDFRGRIRAWFDGSQGWVLVAIIGFITACIAFFVDVTENVLFDWKSGYCANGWYLSKKKCCLNSKESNFCPMWHKWSELITGSDIPSEKIDFVVYILFTVAFATASSLLTMTTKTTLPGSLQITTVDEDLSAIGEGPSDNPKVRAAAAPTSYYSAAGSGVAEVKVILSGFVLHGYLGLKTLVVKTFGLILSVASGLSLGKEGPFVHIATCVGNIACRLFDKYNHNDAKRREMLSASAASGVAVAFGAPIGGVLFSLEEVSYYFPAKTLFRTFFCCIVAALSLKFFNPYGTSKIVLFEVHYDAGWHVFELGVFIFLGIIGGTYGALFIKASKLWATSFRKIKIVKNHPVMELSIVAFTTAIFSYWNRYARMAVSELLFELASPCSGIASENTGLCPAKEDIPNTLIVLLIALALKSVFTVVTFGTKVPAGVYVPTMVIGGLMGHAVGLTVEYVIYLFPDSTLFTSCGASTTPSQCVIPGVYALVCAGAVMCGVTRLSVTLAVILFELTGSLDHVLPFSLAVLVSKWTADAIEPLSIYDLLTDLNSYPYLDTKMKPVFSSTLADITPRPRPERVIDISESSEVPSSELRMKLRILQSSGELDGGLPIVCDGILVGLIPAPDLEFALDNLRDSSIIPSRDGAEGGHEPPSSQQPQQPEPEIDEMCLMSPREDYDLMSDSEGEDDREGMRWGRGGAGRDPTDFTPFIDPAPMALEKRSPMDLVYECFAKLGLRYLCVIQDGRFAGVVHKKTFVKYLKEVSDHQ